MSEPREWKFHVIEPTMLEPKIASEAEVLHEALANTNDCSV
ncbi:MAG: hypothetical protein QM769_14810 [Pseudoxanthomonas sp.]